MLRICFRTCLITLLFSSQLFADIEYFVSTCGSSTNPGTQASPFATLEQARNAIRKMKASTSAPPEKVIVWIEAGTYYLQEPLILSEEDSGTETAPIIYRARAKGEVRIVGGQEVKGFQPVTDPKIIKRLSRSIRRKVLCADLSTADISDFGQVAPQYGAPLGQRLELLFQDQPMQLARWPNKGFVRIVETLGETPSRHGSKGTAEGKFTYSGDRPKRWKDEQEIWLHGYWFWDWADSFDRVASIDTKNRVIVTEPPYHGHGYRKGQRYYALNVLAELDQPGEWYLDRQNKILYFLPPTPINEGNAVFSIVPHLFVLKDCSWVTIRGLILEVTRSTAVMMSGGTGNIIAGCTIRNTGSRAVSISGGMKNSVLGCDIYRTGADGVLLEGGDRQSLTSAGHRVENNHIHHFGRIYRAYKPAVYIRGVGNYVRHNLLHDGPHNAILLTGNDHVIEFNEIHHVCLETSDVGAFYMGRNWTERGTIIRHNYFHHINGADGIGAMGVYLDDAASGISIIGNIFYRVSRAVFIHGGRDNLVENNVFVDCSPSTSVLAHGGAWGVGWKKYANRTLPRLLTAVPYKQPPWSTKYPTLVNILDDEPGSAKGNIIRRNISFGGKWLYAQDKARPYVTFEGNLVGTNPHFVDPKRQDFRLKLDSPAFPMGFQQIPVEKIGLYRDEYRTEGKFQP